MDKKQDRKSNRKSDREVAPSGIIPGNISTTSDLNSEDLDFLFDAEEAIKREKLEKLKLAQKRWKDLEWKIRKFQGPLAECLRVANVLPQLVLQHLYPRLDVNVSKQTNHLLKSVFSVHPKTGQVCVPIDPLEIDNFDPFTVPTISELLKQVDRLPSTSGEKKFEEADEKLDRSSKMVQWAQQTSLAGPIAFFAKFVQSLESGSGGSESGSDKKQKKKNSQNHQTNRTYSSLFLLICTHPSCVIRLDASPVTELVKMALI